MSFNSKPSKYEKDVRDFLSSTSNPYKFVPGDSHEVLKAFPDESVSMAMTSPPYWMQRSYSGNSRLGHEESPEEYVSNLTSVFHELKRVLRRDGSLWLNIGDTYEGKNLCGIPWSVARSMQGDGWILRQAVIWDKVKGNPSTSRDKLRNMYEFVFHFVRMSKYYFDLDSIRNPPGKPYRKEGKIVTATGVSGKKYKRQIHLSKALTGHEKQMALVALAETLRKVEMGVIPDFRMVIRGTQRATHSDDPQFSGRASELRRRGFYILPYHSKGTAPGDVWRVIPEDSWRKDTHFAVYPKELCWTPIKSTCPPGGLVLDPFSGTGTTVLAALELNRRGIGIETSEEYVRISERRIKELFMNRPLTPYMIQ